MFELELPEDFWTNFFPAIAFRLVARVFMSFFRSFAAFTFSLLVMAPLAMSEQPAPDRPLRATLSPMDNWVPEGMNALSSRASFHTDFTFDKQMLGLASGFTGDEETQRIAAKLRSISVHLFSYSQPGLYDPAALNAVREEYSARGWQHLSTRRSRSEKPHPGRTDLDEPRQNAPAEPGRTDVWIRMDHGNVEGMVLLLANSKNVDLIVVNGTLSPLDLLHLRGHFGIPPAKNDGFGGSHLVPDSR